MEGDVNNRWLIEGFSIHENPCRTRYAQERKKQVPPLPEFSSPTPGDLLVEDGQTKEWNLHVPWGNPRVERSGFWFVPTLLTSYAVADLECGRDHTARFTLKTCGAATFWVNEKPVSDFAPYTRNVEHSVNLEVPLKKGNNRLLIRFEDLAERDTMYYFRLDYEGPEEPAIVLPLGSVNPEEVRAAERMFAGFHFQTDTVRGDRIELRWDEPAPRDMDVNVVVGGLLNGSEERRPADQGE